MNLHGTCMLAFKGDKDSKPEWYFYSILDLVTPNKWSSMYWFDRNYNFWKQVKEAKVNFINNMPS